MNQTNSIRCTNCDAPFPDDAILYRCPVCGGMFDYVKPISFSVDQVDDRAPGIWKYRHTFGLPENAPVVSLGEGNTPLVWADAFGEEIGFKLEFLNPTGSFKDRGTVPLMSLLVSHGVKEAVEDSSGNAGASFAAYTARTGIRAEIFVPDYASGPKRRQMEIYGANVVRVKGKRSNASDAVRLAAEDGKVYASHAYLPQVLPGYATIAYELLAQMGKAPGTVVVPAGQGSLLLGIGRGFRALQAAGVIDAIPKLVGVQAEACAPLWAVFANGRGGLMWVREGATLAEGVRIIHPLRGDKVLQMVADSGGSMVAVEEDAIMPGRDELARRGFFVELTSAIVWDAIGQIIEEFPHPIVAILTGSGFKSVD